MAIDFFMDLKKTKILHPTFLKLKNSPEYMFAKAVLERVQVGFKDIDGNFVDQFQIVGFDQRVFELYLGEVFSECGFTRGGDYGSPDFIIEKNGISIAVEATTASPFSNNGIVEYDPFPKWGAEAESVKSKRRNEWAIRIGSPLFKKLQKEYWKLPQVAEKPLVFAIQDLSRSGSLVASSSTIMQYLYGVEFDSNCNDQGDLVPTFEKIKEHRVGEKVVPSGFFEQPGAEYVSAVLFSNTGDLDTFNRMGYVDSGYDPSYLMFREGMCYGGDSKSILPSPFVYRLGSLKAPVERWSTGLVVAHNPNAKYPLPSGFFGDAVENFQNDEGAIVSGFNCAFLPHSSMTSVFKSGPSNGIIYAHYAEKLRKFRGELGDPYLASFL